MPVSPRVPVRGPRAVIGALAAITFVTVAMAADATAAPVWDGLIEEVCAMQAVETGQVAGLCRTKPSAATAAGDEGAARACAAARLAVLRGDQVALAAERYICTKLVDDNARYADGHQVRSGGTFYFPNGMVLFGGGDTAYYSSGIVSISGTRVQTPTGAPMVSGSSSYFANGAPFRSGSGLYEPNGAVISQGDRIYHSNGQPMNLGAQLLYPNGTYARYAGRLYCINDSQPRMSATGDDLTDACALARICTLAGAPTGCATPAAPDDWATLRRVLTRQAVQAAARP